jgi:hypothetical protein
MMGCRWTLLRCLLRWILLVECGVEVVNVSMKSGIACVWGSKNPSTGVEAESRLPILTGILRIPVFSVPVAFFHRNHDSCSAGTFLLPLRNPVCMGST